MFKESKFVDTLAMVVILLCFGYFYFKGLDNGLIALSAAIVSFYFGSSQKDKSTPPNNNQ